MLDRAVKDRERDIEKRVGEFDVISLLRLLMAMGYGPREIRFRGHDSICSQPRMLIGIRFHHTEGGREAEITLSLGLLGGQSPLPSYFKRVLEADVTSAGNFAKFIGFFDHQIIRDFLCSLYPELARFFQGTSELSVADYLQVFDLRSVSALHVLFSKVFPELEVGVEKVTLSRALTAESVRVGETHLGGTCVFGQKTAIPVWGRRITLHSEDEETQRQQPWPKEAERRMKRLLFPRLAPLAMELEINLILDNQSRWVRLQPRTCLGYDTLFTQVPRPRCISLFQGQITI